MAGRTAVLRVNIISDARGAAQGMDQAEQATGRFQSGMQKLAKAAAVTWVVDKVASFGREIYALASEAEQNLGAVDTVFGKSAQAVKDWSTGASDAVGMSASSYQSLANQIGGSLKSAYSDTDVMASKTNELIGAAADLSSVFGGDAVEASAAMGSALRGEFNPLERFGIFLNAAAVQARLAADGNDKLTGAALDAAKKQTTQNMIMEQAGAYAGNFAKEADTAAGAQQRATAKWEDARAKLGAGLLPVVSQAAALFGQFSDWVGRNTGMITALVVGLGGLLGILIAYNGVMLATNLIMSANPFTIAMLAIAAMVAGLIVAYNKIGWFKDFVDLAWKGIQIGIGATVTWLQTVAWPIIQQVWDRISQGAQAVYEGFILPAFTAIQSIVQKSISFITNIVKAGMALFRGDFSGAMGFLKSAVQDGLAIAVTWFQAFPGRIISAIGALGGLLVRKGAEALQGMLQGVENGWNNLRNWLGGIGQRVLSAVGYLNNLLAGAGRAVMQSLLDGIVNGFNKVKNFVGGIADWIARNKGPLPYDRRLLRPAGKAIMQGLLKSMQGEVPAVKKFLGGLTATIGSFGADLSPVSMVAGARGGSTSTSSGGSSSGPAHVTVEVKTGVGDPVAIGREVAEVLGTFYKTTGRGPSWA